MSETRFTPGPWEIYRLTPKGLNHNGDCLVEGNGSTVAMALYLGGTARAIANAHLIAAAPELYAALEKLTKAISECHACGAELTPDRGPAHCVDCPSGCECHEEPDCAELRVIVSEADAALAKARGEEPKP